VGDRTAKAIGRAVETRSPDGSPLVVELAYHRPLRFVDRRNRVTIAMAREDDVATIVAPQPKAVSSEPKPRPVRPPRSAGATIIAFDDDDLLDD
jgi:hypothetical protein